MRVDITYNPEDFVFGGSSIFNTDSPQLQELKYKDILAKHNTGVYEYWNFNSPYLPNYNFKHIYEVYGVCDNYQQIFERDENIQPYISDKSKKYIILLTYVDKSQQPDTGGWRWCKWGEYIGDYNSVAEYLYDEPEIEGVFVYQLFEVT